MQILLQIFTYLMYFYMYYGFVLNFEQLSLNYTFNCFQVKPYNMTVTLALPPDTDTPGFAEEQKNKPQETRQISESAGLVAPEQVASQMVHDALVRQHIL